MNNNNKSFEREEFLKAKKFYTKIKGVSINVCTAEQKIAYNLAFSYSDLFADKYRNANSDSEKIDIINEASFCLIDFWKSSYCYTDKYHLNSIFRALTTGLDKYIKDNHPVLTSYESIGEYFGSIIPKFAGAY